MIILHGKESNLSNLNLYLNISFQSQKIIKFKKKLLKKLLLNCQRHNIKFQSQLTIIY